mmetsp:Transcript_44659/g.100074  ORF Transcript_44659/g.100074 Transcript_44659/m.100074 type:complete len:418 (+) Transcript_44659:60-1313(+)
MARPETMFDAEVVSELRRQFDEADKDGSGEIDAKEACTLFARSCDEAASEDEVRKTAEALQRQVDTDRSGTISFDEYCFRFGRRYQMELNRRKRAERFAPRQREAPTNEPESKNLEQERAELQREREALRQERERLQLEKEREAVRREREALERERQASQGANASAQERTLVPGVRVRIQGLRGAPELNGLEATVLRFDEASGRYVVDVAGGKGQKSLKDANLIQIVESSGLMQKLNAWTNKAFRQVQHGCAHVQVWLANSGYTWWQILLGLAVVVLVISAWVQASYRHGPRKGPGSSADFQSRPVHSDEAPPRREQRAERRRHRRPPRYEDDDYGYSSYDDGDSWGGGGGGFGLGGMQMYLVLAVLAVLCWKGIIPIHRMDWFQLYMLWNLIQSTGLLGGRGGHYGGFGRRRRGFF